MNLLVLLPLAIILILLSVANRQLVNFSLDPLNTETPAIAFTLPFFVFLFLALFLGMALGAFMTWFSQGKYRKALREKSYEANRLRREKEEMADEKSESSAEIAPGLPLITDTKKVA